MCTHTNLIEHDRKLCFMHVWSAAGHRLGVSGLAGLMKMHVVIEESKYLCSTCTQLHVPAYFKVLTVSTIAVICIMFAWPVLCRVHCGLLGIQQKQQECLMSSSSTKAPAEAGSLQQPQLLW
jgi:hypothetical protein